MNQVSSRLRRQASGRIELKLSPQPSARPRLSDLRAGCAAAVLTQFREEVGQVGVTWAVEVEHVLESPLDLPPKEATRLPFAKGSPELCRASQRRSKRRPVHVFE
jgi:hypothetical protein